jgi:hypothetical protein
MSAKPVAASVVAAVLPLLLLAAFWVAAVAVAGPDGAVNFIREGGAASYLVLFVASVAAVGCAGAVFALARGKAVPSAVPALLGALPWVAGSAGTLYALRVIEQAVASANIVDKGIIAAVGSAEALSTRLLGAWSASALFAGAAVGLGVAALASPSRSSLKAGLVGAALALPMLALSVASMGALRLGAALPLVVALAAVAACAAAVAGVGADDADPQALRLATAAAACAGLSFAAACLVSGPAVERELLSLFGRADPSQRATLVGLGLVQASAAALLVKLGPLLALLPVAALALWAASRSAAGRSPVAAAALVLVVTGVVGVDGVSARRTVALVRKLAGAPWAQVADFRAMAFEGDGNGDEVRVVVTPREVIALDGKVPSVVLAVNAKAPMTAMLSKVRAQVAAAEAAALQEESGDEGGSPFAKMFVKPASAPRDELNGPLRELLAPTLVMAVDARVSGRLLGVLLAAAQNAGYRSVRFAGETELGQRVRQGAGQAPLLEAMWSQAFTPAVLLAAAMPPERAARDPILFHGRPSEDGSVLLAPRAGSAEPPRTVKREADGRFEEREWQGVGDGGPAAYLTLDDAVRPTALAELLVALPGHGLWPVLALGAVPGGPGVKLESPVKQRDNSGPSSDATRDSEPTVTGTLDRELIRQVVHRNRNQVRYCYESQLSTHPNLAGKVTLGFVIGRTGQVTSARIQSSTVKSPELLECLVTRFKTWAFPKPKGGGVVTVAYPLTFELPDE